MTRQPPKPGESGASRARPAVLTPPVGIPVVPELPTQRAEPVAPSPPGPDISPAAPTSRPRTARRTLCRCGHDADTHEHMRPGRDCGACGAELCPRFRARKGGRAGRVFGRIAGWLRLRP